MYLKGVAWWIATSGASQSYDTENSMKKNGAGQDSDLDDEDGCG